MSEPPETEDRSENLTAGKRRYNRRSQLQNAPQQQQQQRFVANLNAAVPPLPQYLLGTSQYLAPSIPQIATG